MKTLNALLTLAAGNDSGEKAARWKNARLALAINGQYQENGMQSLAETIGRKRITVYKWAEGAGMYKALVGMVKDFPYWERRYAYRVLSKAARVLGIWHFIVIFELWKYIEDPRSIVEDLRTATENRTPLEQFKDAIIGDYKPDPPMDYQIQARKADRQMEKVLASPFLPYRTEVRYKLARWLMNGATSVTCPDCENEIEIERFAKSQKHDTME